MIELKNMQDYLAHLKKAMETARTELFEITCTR